MKVIFLNEIGGKLQLKEVTTPKPDNKQVLIKVQYAGVNFADSQIRVGQYPAIPQMPVVLGAEVAGTIIELGGDVNKSLLGKRVVAVLSGYGGYAEYAVASINEFVEIPDNVSYEDALAVPIQGLTAYFLLTQSSKIIKGDTIFVHAAAGGVGSIAIQLAKLLGISKVFAGASSDWKLAIAKSLGADVLVNYTNENWADRIKNEIGDQGINIILSSATDDVAKHSFNILAPYGRFVIYGSLDVKISAFGPQHLLPLIFKNQSIVGFFIGSYSSVPGNFQTACNYLFNLIRTGQLKIITSSSYDFENAQQAHEDMANRKTVGKVVLKFR